MKESKNIIEGSKLIAEYMGMRYIPFNDLQGFPKAGWYNIKSTTPDIKTVKTASIKLSNENINAHNLFEGAEYKEVEVDINIFKYQKNGYSVVGDNYVKFVCRNHSGLRFYNSMDALLPVIQKLEREYNLNFDLYNNGASFSRFNFKIGYSFDESQTWIQNTFGVIVKAIKYGK